MRSFFCARDGSSLAAASFGEACDAVEALEGLDDGQKERLVELLYDLRRSKGDEGMAEEAVKALVNEGVGFGFEALRAVLPYVWAFLLSLAGA